MSNATKQHGAPPAATPDKPGSSRQETLLRLEGKVTDLCAAMAAANFMIGQLIVEDAEAKEGRAVIEMDDDNLSALFFMTKTLAREMKDFREFFYREWKEGTGPSSV
jgi:hypothetical protein